MDTDKWNSYVKCGVLQCTKKGQVTPGNLAIVVRMTYILPNRVTVHCRRGARAANGFIVRD
jgi:hypothetical protein